MHPIEIKIRNYLERANTEQVGMDPDVVQRAAANFAQMLNKRFNEPPYDDTFRLRMSNVGRPLCQLQMEKAGAKREPMSYNFPMQMMLGDTMEILILAIAEASGVELEEVNKETSITINGTKINGTDDVEIDNKVWDVKSASPWSYTNKFGRGFGAVADKDSFGYVDQGFGYAEGRQKSFGGWIVGQKSTGEIQVCEAPESKEAHEQSLKNIEMTVKALEEDAPFERCFEDEVETHYKKPTGNRKLGISCKFCPYKWECWPTLQYAQNPKSKAKSPPFEYYTEMKDIEDE